MLNWMQTCRLFQTVTSCHFQYSCHFRNYRTRVFRSISFCYWLPTRVAISDRLINTCGSRTKHPGTKHPMPFFATPDKTSHEDLPPQTNIPCCFCHPGHNIPCCFCHPGHNIPCHFRHPGQNIPHSDCSFLVSLIWDLHLFLHVLAVNALVRLSKWYKLDLKLIERQFHSVKFNKR